MRNIVKDDNETNWMGKDFLLLFSKENIQPIKWWITNRIYMKVDVDIFILKIIKLKNAINAGCKFKRERFQNWIE